jgi:hypothetical protein
MEQKMENFHPGKLRHLELLAESAVKHEAYHTSYGNKHSSRKKVQEELKEAGIRISHRYVGQHIDEMLAAAENREEFQQKISRHASMKSTAR